MAQKVVRCAVADRRRREADGERETDREVEVQRNQIIPRQQQVPVRQSQIRPTVQKKGEKSLLTVRLDLNLEVEIYVHAKIHGDVTLTVL